MEKMYKKGDIYFIKKTSTTGCEQRGGRPAIIVSNDIGNYYSQTVEVVYLTTQRKKLLPTHVVICSSPIKSIALCEQICTVDKSRIGDYKGHLTEQECESINAALKISLNIE